MLMLACSGNLIIIPIVDLNSSANLPREKYGINWMYNRKVLVGTNIFFDSIIDAGVKEATKDFDDLNIPFKYYPA